MKPVPFFLSLMLALFSTQAFSADYVCTINTDTGFSHMDAEGNPHFLNQIIIENAVVTENAPAKIFPSSDRETYPNAGIEVEIRDHKDQLDNPGDDIYNGYVFLIAHLLKDVSQSGTAKGRSDYVTIIGKKDASILVGQAYLGKQFVNVDCLRK